jgi:hypothetical protein
MRFDLRLAGLVTVVTLAAASSACSSSSAPPAADQFSGTWKWLSGTVTTTCPGLMANVTQQTGDITLAVGTMANTIVSTGGCNETFTVSGESASASQQSVISDNLVLSNGTLTENGNGTATEGATMCTFTSTGTLSKVAQ